MRAVVAVTDNGRTNISALRALCQGEPFLLKTVYLR